MHVKIVKYGNRKLYNSDSSKYTTIEELAKLDKQGIDLIVIDNTTGKDITKETLVKGYMSGVNTSDLLKYLKGAK